MLLLAARLFVSRQCEKKQWEGSCLMANSVNSGSQVQKPCPRRAGSSSKEGGVAGDDWGVGRSKSEA